MFNTKRQLYTLMSKIYKRLRDEDYMVRFIKNKRLAGRCYPGANWIEVNPNEAILATIVHEMLHDIYPFWSEKKVLSSERLVMAQLSHRQLIKLTIELGNALDRNKDWK